MNRKKRKEAAFWDRIQGSPRRIGLMLGMPGTPKDRRGFAAEEKAEKALHYFSRKRLITRYAHTARYSPDDLDGKDFIVTLLTGDAIAINVKNHRCGWREEKTYLEKGIFLVTIWESDTDEIAREKILNLIVCAYLSRLSLEEVRALIAGALRERIVELPKSLPERFWACLKKAGK